MKLFTKLILVLSSALFLYGSSELKVADSYTDAIEDGIHYDKHVILFTHSPFCPWCRKMEVDTYEHPKVIELLNEHYIFVSVDLSAEVETEDVPAKFLPRSTPVTYVIDPHTQKKLFTMRGYKKPDSFLWRLNK